VSTIKPIFLLSDSQLLFWREEDVPFLERVRKAIEEEEPGKEIRAAYIGASNGDAPSSTTSSNPPWPKWGSARPG
jgi:hypothetical protein